MRIFLFIFTLLFAEHLFSKNTMEIFRKEQKEAFQIIPTPQDIELKGGKGLDYRELTYIKTENGASVPVMGALLNGLPYAAKEGIPLILRISQENVPNSEEGYLLEVFANKIVISAKTMKGLFYGCQTLEQLMEDSRDFRMPIPAMTITDYPAISYRAVHFDVKHHLDRMEYYYRAIDRLARYKINAIIWELEDKLRYTRRPEVAAGNAISKQEMQAICRYAQERNVEISPLVQGLGHAGFILKHHWELRENPSSDWEFCPTNPKTYEFQFDLYRDALEAMPHGRFLHIGGDEIMAIGIDERCKATDKSAFELQMGWLRKVCDFAKSNGRIPIFWDDMPLKYGGLWDMVHGDNDTDDLQWDTQKLDSVIDLFPKDCVYMRWNYRDATRPGHQRILKWYHDKGLRVMAATAASSGNSPVLPREDTKAGYIKGFSRLVAQNQLEGILATSWDDGSPHLETVWRGYIAQGEFGWNPEGRTVEEFKKAHAQREFGFRPADQHMQFLDELEEALYFYDGALVVAGCRNPASGVPHTLISLIELPDRDKPGEWSRIYKEKIDKAFQESKRFVTIDEGVKTAKMYALRGRYALDIYEQINYLQNYSTRLLLALYRYDTADSEADRKTALRRVCDECVYFRVMRKSLEEVYSKTRFMQNPNGYILDMNGHNHLAAKTNNSDWMYYYEIPMVAKVEKWLKKQ
nr:family 20 glycosylhydrolase [Bacteroides intestinalis]